VHWAKKLVKIIPGLGVIASPVLGMC